MVPGNVGLIPLIVHYNFRSGERTMSQVTAAPRVADHSEAQIPYPKSWMDSLIQWIQRVSGPTWLFYTLVAISVAFMNNAVFWLDGSHPVGWFDPVRIKDTGYIVFFIALYHHLSLVAQRSLQKFRPVLKVTEAEEHDLEYRLTILPQSLGWLAASMGVVLGILSVQSDPIAYGLDLANTIIPTIYQAAAQIFVIACLSGLIYQLIRQMRLVNNLHGRASEIDLFQLAPAHAFSTLTARAGIGLSLFIVFNLLVGLTEAGTGAPLYVMAVVGGLAVAVFGIPLLGMRNRLKHEKAQLLSATNTAIKQVIQRIHDQVNSNGYQNIAGLDTTLSALIKEREILSGISTWPWDPSTFRGFASSLLLPIFLWLVTRLLERLL
jgi:hypothetical protein